MELGASDLIVLRDRRNTLNLLFFLIKLHIKIKNPKSHTYILSDSKQL